jgi:nucleotide-binding universal stress UspA family protein
MKKYAQAYLTKLSEKVQKEIDKDKVVKIKTEIVTSNRIADADVSYARDNKIDLIVIGTRGRSKIKSIVLVALLSL